VPTRDTSPMSAENVEAVTAFIDAYNRRDFGAAVEAFHPQVEWVLPERQSSDSCRGPRAVINFWEGIDNTFDDLQLHPQEHIDGGDRVATRLRHYGLAKSGIEIDTELYHQVVTFSDGRMVRIEYFASWPEALEAAGVG
jgi:ketosteroid isomerase-like protein